MEVGPAPVPNLEEALAVHRAMMSSPQLGRLGGLAGFKMGWKNAFPEQTTLYGPLFGVGFMQVTADTVYDHRGDCLLPYLPQHGATVSLQRFKLFGAEAEFGMLLSRSLPPRQAPYTPEEVYKSVDHVELCIELCGARQTASHHKLHYVADALLGAGVVRGRSIGKPDPSSLTGHRVSLECGGKEVSNGDATNNPTDSPLGSLTFLVNDLSRRGIGIQAGAFVICGHCCQAAFQGQPLPPFMAGNLPEAAWREGDTLCARFEGLGAVEVTLRR